MNGVIDYSYSYYLHSSSSPFFCYLMDSPLSPLHFSFMVGKGDPTGETDNGKISNEERKLETHLCVRVRKKGPATTQLYPVLPSYSSASPGCASGMCGSVGEGAPGRKLCSGDHFIPAGSTSVC